MQIYIAYKYSHVKEKTALREDLLKISDILESFGHSTFILGRDVQNWNNKAHPIHSKLMKMVEEIKRAEGMFIYVNSDAFSNGLMFEIHLAKLLGKKIIIAIKEGYKAPYFSFLSSETIKFGNFEELKDALDR